MVGSPIVTAFVRFGGGHNQCAPAAPAIMDAGLRDLTLVAAGTAVIWVLVAVLIKPGFWCWVLPMGVGMLFPILGNGSGLHVSDWKGWAECSSGLD